MPWSANKALADVVGVSPLVRVHVLTALHHAQRASLAAQQTLAMSMLDFGVSHRPVRRMLAAIRERFTDLNGSTATGEALATAQQCDLGLMGAEPAELAEHETAARRLRDGAATGTDGVSTRPSEKRRRTARIWCQTPLSACTPTCSACSASGRRSRSSSACGSRATSPPRWGSRSERHSGGEWPLCSCSTEPRILSLSARA